MPLRSYAIDLISQRMDILASRSPWGSGGNTSTPPGTSGTNSRRLKARGGRKEKGPDVAWGPFGICPKAPQGYQRGQGELIAHMTHKQAKWPLTPRGAMSEQKADNRMKLGSGSPRSPPSRSEEASRSSRSYSLTVSTIAPVTSLAEAIRFSQRVARSDGDGSPSRYCDGICKVGQRETFPLDRYALPHPLDGEHHSPTGRR